MDDAKRLVAELLAKLSELDGRVADYRHDMNAEFRRYRDQLLDGLPNHVSDEVSRVLSESMADYPSLLNPPGAETLPVPAPEPPTTTAPATESSRNDSNSRIGRKSPPPALLRASGSPNQPGPRSPQERENELQGVFTPTYLPLLDSSDRPSSSSSSSFSPSLSPLPPASSTPVPAAVADDVPLSLEAVLDRAARTPPRPTPLRRQTDGTESSVGSAGSHDGIARRRSALRRSSSLSRGSPRRVRFDFQGVQVTPTSSPQAPTSPLATFESADETSAPAPADDSPAYEGPYDGPSLLDVEGEEDFNPLPKKVSSTEALRALTRNHIDEGAAWRVVDPEAEESSLAMNSDEKPSTCPELGTPTDLGSPAADAMPAPKQPRQRSDQAQNDTLSTNQDCGKDDSDDDDGDDDGFLSMPPKSSKKSPILVEQPSSPRSPLASTAATGAKDDVRGQATEQASPIVKAATPSAAHTQQLRVPDMLRGHDEIFDLDDDGEVGGIGESRQRARKGDGGGGGDAGDYLADAIQEDEETDDDDQADEAISLSIARSTPAPYPASPAVAIPQRAPDSQTPRSTPSRMVQGSVGSYKGQPLSISAIISPKVHEEAAALGDFTSFVGSVYDDPGAGSFRPSLSRAAAAASAASAVPRSFSERFALEEAQGEESSE